MKKKRILALFLAAVSCLSLAVSASAAGTTTRKATDFKDYDRTAWYAEAVSAAVDNGLLYGKSSSIIDPNGDMTRAEMAAIINRSFGCYKAADISQYKDVSKSKWYYKDVALAAQMGKPVLLDRIKNAVSLELLPVQGQTRSFADIERRLAQLDEQFQQLLTEAIDAEDKEACNAQFAEILAEQTSLKRQKEAILQSSTDASRVCTRMKQAEQAIENTTQTITEWNENAVRQIVERVTVLSTDEILVQIKGGAEIKQTINK